MKRADKKSILILGLSVLAGFLARVYLLFIMPVWFDEKITLKIINATFSQIASGVLDPTHPPAYYLFLKVISLISSNLYYLRFSTILFFIANTFLLYKLGLKIKEKNLGFWIILLYSLSGYFIVFDWQIRGYTALLTSVLLSLNFYYRKPSKLNNLFFLAVNFLGLFLDYGFVFYLAPLLIIEIWRIVVKSKFNSIFLYLVLSFALYFLTWGLPFLNLLEGGIKGIEWIRNFTTPLFFVPFMLGSHTNMILTFILLLVTIYGIYVAFSKKLKIPVLLVFISFISIIFCIIVGFLSAPILHVRSLQIVGLFVLITQSVSIYNLSQRNRPLAWVLIAFFVLNMVGILLRFPVFPGEFLVRFD